MEDRDAKIMTWAGIGFWLIGAACLIGGGKYASSGAYFPCLVGSVLYFRGSNTPRK